MKFNLFRAYPTAFYLDGKNAMRRCVRQLAIRSALRLFASVCPFRALATIAYATQHVKYKYKSSY
jgi:hypothetical protein